MCVYATLIILRMLMTDGVSGKRVLRSDTNDNIVHPGIHQDASRCQRCRNT